MFKLFGKHYGAERFFILLFVLFLGISSLSVYAGVIQHERNKFTVGSKALYSSDYIWSRTSSTGRVETMVSDSNNTAVFLLLHNDDVSMTSTNADDYEVFLTGTDEPLKNNPAMTVYTFGLSGYVGFYFKDAKGFESQRYTMTIRANSAGSDMADESMWDTGIKDQSFRDNNQIRIILNFGASGVEKLPVMDEPGLTPMKIMCDLDLPLESFGLAGGTSGFEQLKTSAQTTLEKMNSSLVSITQYRATLIENGVNVPELPYYIKDDYVDLTPNDFTRDPSVFELDMLATGGGGSSGTNFAGISDGGSTDTDRPSGGKSGTGATWTDKEGKVHEYMYLHTDYLYPGTCHIPWQGAKLSDGMITNTRFYTEGGNMGLDEAYGLYDRWSKDCEADYKSEMPPSVKYQTWRKLDGSYIDMTVTSGVDGQIPQMINRYVTEVNNYMKLKQTYLTTNNSMLATENAIQSLRRSIYSNNGSSVQNLWLY